MQLPSEITEYNGGAITIERFRVPGGGSYADLGCVTFDQEPAS